MAQMNIFEALYSDFKFNKKEITLFESFAGVGSQAMAMKDLAKELGFTLKTIGISEIDKHAIASYNAIHGETKNYGSICDIQEIPQVDIFTYSFPCQDISLAGKQKGFTKGSGTRSGLLWEVERLLENQYKVNKLPKVLLMENVKALAGVKFIDDFHEWRNKLVELGYSNYWEILNAKDYGIPQNRERVFMVSILGDYNYTFPKPFELKLTIENIILPQEKKCYKYNDMAISLKEDLSMNIGYPYRLGGAFDKEGKERQGGGIFSVKGISPTITAGQWKHHFLYYYNNKIYVASELECWRLMGFSDQDFTKAQAVCSNTQLYKQAGNSIVVDVLYYIFKQLF